MFPHNFDEGYEQSGFHKYTGWGNWLLYRKFKITKKWR